jgi:hypothetical protein
MWHITEYIMQSVANILLRGLVDQIHFLEEG